ncbi:50S ribosomal protein L25 [Desulfobulbus alkaliphilus]|uniref:50S ribosomal protein L25 n=1 Tax=Desulfobulbus alkaliphilus TaxID=869814 RepID=UPI0019633EF3|nr:50S ribosomal protein L25 [Desulfobulbus alkaliphilus]MBM9536372.1 50S ribosomal protein L25 [Desulfobulbus alkaliphilus]
MLQVNIESTVRSVFGKGPMRQMRMRKMTPANLYSKGLEPVPLQFETAKLFKSLLSIQGRNAVVTLQIEGDSKDKRNALVKEIQKEPVSGKVLHVDFFEIELDRAVPFTVPIEFSGVAKGVDLGGELQIFRNTVRLRGCPLDIPDMIKVDVTPLEQGGRGLTFGDLDIPQNVEMLEKAGTTVVTVY